jgi:hypothetical protein
MEEAEGTKLCVSYRPLAVEYFPVPIKPNKLTHAYTTWSSYFVTIYMNDLYLSPQGRN